jgi:hypothetical protein
MECEKRAQLAVRRNLGRSTSIGFRSIGVLGCVNEHFDAAEYGAAILAPILSGLVEPKGERANVSAVTLLEHLPLQSAFFDRATEPAIRQSKCSL